MAPLPALRLLEGRLLLLLLLLLQKLPSCTLALVATDQGLVCPPRFRYSTHGYGLMDEPTTIGNTTTADSAACCAFCAASPSNCTAWTYHTEDKVYLAKTNVTPGIEF